MGLIDFILDFFSDNKSKEIQKNNEDYFYNLSDETLYLPWRDIVYKDGSKKYLYYDSVGYIDNCITGTIVQGKDNKITQSWTYKFSKDNSKINVNFCNNDVGAFDVNDYDLRQDHIYTFYLICYCLKRNTFTSMMFDFSKNAKYGINQKNKEANQLIKLSKLKIEFLYDNPKSNIAAAYIPKTVKYSAGKLDVWLHDVSKLIIVQSLRFDDYFRAHSLYHAIFDFNNNTVQYITIADINTKDEIFYLLHPNKEGRLILSYKNTDLEFLWYKYFKEKYFKKIHITKDYIMSLNWREFEYFIAKCYENIGYETQVTPPSWDKGKDIIAKKNGITYFIECKHYSSETIGREYLQKLIGAAGQYGVKNVIFVTTSTFNANAYECLKETNKNGMFKLEFVDMNGIIELASNAFNEDINIEQIISSRPTNKTYSRNKKICPRCHTGYLRKIKGRNGLFCGCSEYPVCTATFNIHNK